jgi:phosphohistidine phosphatase
MQILLVRHGDAVEHGARTDGERWLTPKGRLTTRAVAAALAAEQVVPSQIFTSPLVRAVQTSEILAAEYGFNGPFEVLPALVPHGDPEQVIVTLDGVEDGVTVALVGHEPSVSTLAGQLLGVSFPPLKKSAVCSMRRSPTGRYSFEWMLLPKTLVRVVSLEGLDL